MNKKTDSKVIKFPTNLTEPERQVEAILFSAEEPLDLEIETDQNKQNSFIEEDRFYYLNFKDKTSIKLKSESRFIVANPILKKQIKK